MAIHKTALILFFTVLLQGCSSVGYYWEKIQGHSEIIAKQQPVQEVIDNPETSSILRERLMNTQAARNFASEVLKLPDNDSYRNYADIGRDYVVWMVVATPPYSIKAKEWCFLVVGCLSYRGYFSKKSAEEFAEQLKKQNMDVYVSGTKAYSTLGWFDDPLLNTMLYKSEAYRVGIIFHELAHQKIYIENDTASNEAFASTVELEGVKAWFSRAEKKQEYQKYFVSKQRDEDFKKILKQTRDALNTLYLSDLQADAMKKGKESIFRQLQISYKDFKTRWDNYKGYDKWMSKNLNNAHLALVATYNERIPAFRKLFKDSGNNYALFYKKAEALMMLEKQQRDAEFDKMLSAR